MSTLESSDDDGDGAIIVHQLPVCSMSKSGGILLFHMLTYDNVYSGTSLNGPSEMRTTSVQRTARKAPFDFSMRLVHF